MSANDQNKPERRIAPFQEREQMKREIKIAERDDRGESPEFSREVKKYLSQNPDDSQRVKNLNRRHLNRLNRTLRNSEPEPLTDAEVKKLEEEEKILVEKCSKMMVPKKMTQLKEFDGSEISTEFRKAANHMSKMEHSKEFLNMAFRLKNIRRKLRSDDPDAGNLENIRPD